MFTRDFSPSAGNANSFCMPSDGLPLVRVFPCVFSAGSCFCAFASQEVVLGLHSTRGQKTLDCIHMAAQTCSLTQHWRGCWAVSPAGFYCTGKYSSLKYSFLKYRVNKQTRIELNLKLQREAIPPDSKKPETCLPHQQEKVKISLVNWDNIDVMYVFNIIWVFIYNLKFYSLKLVAARLHLNGKHQHNRMGTLLPTLPMAEIPGGSRKGSPT